MIVDAGLDLIRDWITGGAGSPPTHIGVGIGTTAPTQGNTVLNNEVYPTTSRTSGDKSRTEDVVHFKMNMATGDGSTATYSEHGLFTNSTTGTMFSRLTHPDTSKDDNVVMETIVSVEVGSYLP